MAGLTIYTLGHSGVIIDMNPVEPTTPIDSLLLAQNANHQSTAAYGGALRKRPGLRQFNELSAGGPILGGIPMSVAGTGGAPTPATQPGPGSPTGDPTGAPPGGVPGPGTPGINPAGPPGGGGTIFSPGRIFNGARVVVIARDDARDVNESGGTGWYVTDQNLVDAAFIDDSITNATQYGPIVQAGPPGRPTFSSGHLLGVLAVGSPPSTLANGALYYAQATNVTPSTTPVLPILRKLTPDGLNDKAIVNIPDNPFILAQSPIPSHGVAILSLLTEFGNGDAMYVSTYDYINSGALSGAGSKGSYGRVLRISGLDTGNYLTTEVYNSLNTNAVVAFNGTVNLPTVPNALEFFLGALWIGTWRGQAGLAHNPAIGQIRPDLTQPDGWGVANVIEDAVANEADIACMKTYNGILYFGTVHDGATAAKVYAYTGSPAAVTTSLTPSANAPQNPNGFVSMIVFNGLLLASYYNPNGTSAQIYQFNGTTWSIVYTGATLPTLKPITFAIDNGTLYGIGGALVLWSTDGTTFNDASVQVPSTGSGFPLPVLMGYAQP